MNGMMVTTVSPADQDNRCGTGAQLTKVNNRGNPGGVACCREWWRIVMRKRSGAEAVSAMGGSTAKTPSPRELHGLGSLGGPSSPMPSGTGATNCTKLRMAQACRRSR
jgi:hypothetical protein